MLEGLSWFLAVARNAKDATIMTSAMTTKAEAQRLPTVKLMSAP
jgi:hypothetical protein